MTALRNVTILVTPVFEKCVNKFLYLQRNNAKRCISFLSETRWSVPLRKGIRFIGQKVRRERPGQLHAPYSLYIHQPFRGGV